jgi:hypothetical protein
MMLQAVHGTGYVPPNYFLHEDEWGQSGYPSREEIPVGFRTQRRLKIDLPYSVWYPRAVRWAQAATLLNRLLQSE